MILCNRKLLRKQYFYSLIDEFVDYLEMKEAVEVKTYQELAENIKNGKILDFMEYYSICLDEVHYFIQDSDFNGMGTYPLFVAIMLAGVGKQMIFMSATIDFMRPFISDMLQESRNYWWTYYLDKAQTPFREYSPEHIEILEPTRDFVENYNYLQCIYVPDEETLCHKIAESDGKSIIFIDDKKAAENFVTMLKNMGKMTESEICVLHADNLENDENSEVIKALTMANKLISKVLITTSVLDNGVSIKDREVKNIVIMTESEVSFKQMLGRVRSECVEEKLMLYFVPRSAEYYERREIQYRRIIEKYEEIKKRTLKNCIQEILEVMLYGNEEEKAVYKKFIIYFHQNFYIDDSMKMRELSCKKGNLYFAVNPFAIKKISDAYMTAAKLHKLARTNSLRVIYEQLEWIGLNKEDLQIEDSSYLKKRSEEFLHKLISVNEFTNKELVRFKEEINAEFGKEFFRDIVAKKGAFETEKFKKILQRFNCELREFKGKDGKKRYSVVEKGRDCK